MTHEEIRDLLDVYVLGFTEEPENREIEEHLPGCAACSTFLREAVALASAIGATAEPVSPPASLRRRVIATVVPPRMMSWPAVAAIAAGLAVAAWLGVANRRQGVEIAELRQDYAEQTRSLQRYESAFSFLRDPQTRPAGLRGRPAAPSGNYYTNPKGGILLIASGLPALQPKQVYEMWVIPEGQAPRPAGVFRGDEGGGAVHYQPDVNLTGAEALALTLAVTVEPEGGSPAPTTTPMIATRVTGL